MDYFFAPGGTSYDHVVRRMFIYRSDTSEGRRRGTVKQFVERISTHASVTRPIDNILLGTHASSSGLINIPMYPRQRGRTTYTILQETIDDSTKSVAIPDATIGHSAGDPITHSVNIKGCNIGKSAPFLTKLKEALGGNVNVTAPKHFHFIYLKRRLGVFELMAYEFVINQVNPAATRQEIIDTYESGEYYSYDGTFPVLGSFGNWVPARVTPRVLGRTQKVRQRLTVPLGQSFGRTSTVPFYTEFRSKRDRFRYTIPYSNRGEVPTSQADQQAAFFHDLSINPIFADTHPLPRYVSMGYETRLDFRDGYAWTYRRSGRHLVCTGYRHKYTLLVPITHLTTNNAIFNFYPRTGSSHTPVLDGLQTSDNQFFATV